jgi:hypothetical protein
VFIEPKRPCEREHVRTSKRRRLNIKRIRAKLRACAVQNQQGFPMAFRKFTLLAAIAAALPIAAAPAFALGDGPAIASELFVDMGDADLRAPLRPFVIF